MDIGQKVIGALAFSLMVVCSSGFAADKEGWSGESFKTVSFRDWVRVDVFDNDEKDCNAEACSLEAFKKVFPDAGGVGKDVGIFYKGVSDIVYMTAFNNAPYVLLVQACGADPKKFDGSTWSFPGGRNDQSYPAVAALREGEEETAKFFGFPPDDPQLFVALKNMVIMHFQNPHPRFKGTPMSLAIVPVKADLDWPAMSHNFQLASTGYDRDMKEKGRPAPHHEKQNGAWVLLEDILGRQFQEVPNDHIAGHFTVFNPVEREKEERDLLVRKSGIYPFLTFPEARNTLEAIGQKVAK